MLNKFGEDLRQIRESKNISLNDIANKTKIHISFLERMENGEFTFYSAAYIRAFIKEYAKCIGLKSDDVLYNYELAKSGKYTSILHPTQPPKSRHDRKESEKKPEIQKEVIKEVPKEVIKEVPKETPKVILEEIHQEPEIIANEENKIDDVFSVPVSEPPKNDIIKGTFDEIPEKEKVEKRPFSTSVRKKLETGKGEFDGEYLKERGFKMPVSLLKNIGIVVLVLAILGGLYLLIDLMFLHKKAPNEIVHQNFDEVVKETEKKVLGKRTEQEIKDSIAKEESKRDSLKSIPNDVLKLSIKAKDKITVVVYIDSVSEKSRNKKVFKSGEQEEWSAKNQFYLTTKDTKGLEVILDGKKLSFEDTEIKQVKITKQGIVKKKELTKEKPKKEEPKKKEKKKETPKKKTTEETNN